MKSERLAKLPVFTQVTGPLWARLPMTCPRSLKPQSPDRGWETGHLIASSDGGRPLTWVTASICALGSLSPDHFFIAATICLRASKQLLGCTGLVDGYLNVAAGTKLKTHFWGLILNKHGSSDFEEYGRNGAMCRQQAPHFPSRPFHLPHDPWGWVGGRDPPFGLVTDCTTALSSSQPPLPSPRTFFFFNHMVLSSISQGEH